MLAKLYQFQQALNLERFTTLLLKEGIRHGQLLRRGRHLLLRRRMHRLAWLQQLIRLGGSRYRRP